MSFFPQSSQFIEKFLEIKIAEHFFYAIFPFFCLCFIETVKRLIPRGRRIKTDDQR